MLNERASEVVGYVSLAIQSHFVEAMHTLVEAYGVKL
jgi:hypothetical protein